MNLKEKDRRKRDFVRVSDRERKIERAQGERLENAHVEWLRQKERKKEGESNGEGYEREREISKNIIVLQKNDTIQALVGA